MIERTAVARRASLDSLFIGDQHVSPTPYYQNTPMLGRLLAEWGETPAGCLFLLPLWHPVLGDKQAVWPVSGQIASIEAHRPNSSLLTHRWREPDSNHRSRCCVSCFIPTLPHRSTPPSIILCCGAFFRAS